HREGVVLDLRGNPGGLVDAAVEVAGAFLDGGTVVSYDRRGHSRTTLSAPPGGDVHTPLVVLVDAGTASAAEVVSAALQERNRAVLVGTRTFGKGSVQEPVELPDGGALELTVGRYFTPSGRSIEGIGLTPDVTLAASDDPAVALRRGVDVLAGLVASLPGSGRG
ncbi:MAG: S41 family peptidase, partial [Actinomycetales bacterium]